jgi:glycosyltransferase involved in cell wall biosynthesis
MHIVYLCPEYPPSRHGGIGSFIQTLGRALAARGHQVTVIGLYDPAEAGESDDQGVRVIRVPKRGWPGTRFLQNGARLGRVLRELHTRHPVDLVEGAEMSYAVIASGFPVPKVLRMHGGPHFFGFELGAPPGRWAAWQERRSFAVANHLLAVSDYVADRTREYLTLGDRPIDVIYNPVDLASFRPDPSVAEVPGRIVYVGTLIEKKGIRQLIAAMPAICERFPEAHLEVCGNDTVIPQTGSSFRAALEVSIPEALRPRIRFRGGVPRSELPPLMASASLCVYPSHMEAMPLAWIEGLAMQKAVLASCTGPGAEVITHGVDGLLCNPHEPASIAEGVATALADPALRARLGAAARLRAEQQHALAPLVERNLEYYHRVLSGQTDEIAAKRR